METDRRNAALGLLLAVALTMASAQAENVASDLALDEAIDIALGESPALRALKSRIDAETANARQAGILPNPELEGVAENIAGSGEFSGTDAAEYTVMVSQPFLLGGKRSKGVRVADLDRRLAEWTYESTKRDLIQAVTATFAEVLEAQENVEISRELVHLSEELVQTAARRVKAGGASVLEQTKAEIERAASIVNREQMQQRLVASRRRLAALLRTNPATPRSVSGNLYEMDELPSFDRLEQQLADNPDWARWSTEIEQRKATVALEDAQRVPDVSLGVGWRRLEGADSDAFVLAAGIPLPLFDRNQGARQAARYEQIAAVEERAMILQELERELAAVYSELSQAYTQATAIKTHILPAARKSFDVSRKGYLQGRFGYLDLLDAQRTLFETRASYTEALRTYHQAVAEIERLTTRDPNVRHFTTEE